MHGCKTYLGIEIANIPKIGPNKDQQQSLLHLKKSLQFDQPSYSTKVISWNSSTDCCSWLGVTCTGNGNVFGLDLSLESISGPIPGSFASFSNLRELDLSSNNISGPIPGILCQLFKLEGVGLEWEQHLRSNSRILCQLFKLEGVGLEWEQHIWSGSRILCQFFKVNFLESQWLSVEWNISQRDLSGTYSTDY
ncbi:unnamed protein product [Prunus armeniaca]|uniref:Leucine-rich repeat-containing N-terminal plant-type domain-containing protein n=1 Tax=Prunus armeniaca TaxID=36596 RepID=A0A6J5V727_PRUAR|nr:unnamed protein product [Prunus armeniaca]